MKTESKSQAQDSNDMENVVETVVATVKDNPLMARMNRELDMVQAALSDMVIDSDELYTTMADKLQEVNGKVKDLGDHRMTLTRPLDESKKRIIELFRPTIERGEGIVSSIKLLLLDYSTRKRLEREAAERVARQAAAAEEARVREAARIERLAVEEKARLEREQAQEAQRAAAAAAAAADNDKARELAAERQRVANQAAAEADQRARDEADRLARDEEDRRFAPAHVPAIPVTRAPAVKGITERRVWKADTENLAKLVCHIADRVRAGDFSALPLIKPDATEIGKRARALGEHMNIPGIKVWDEASIGAGRR